MAKNQPNQNDLIANLNSQILEESARLELERLRISKMALEKVNSLVMMESSPLRLSQIYANLRSAE